MAKGTKTSISKFYQVEGGQLKRLRPTCPRCGPSVFMADHYDRQACGKCGYTTFKKRDGAPRRATRAAVKRQPRKRRAVLQK
ncbi:MAG: hypothetical protein Kow0069_12370 [Promethearchaeota archaeon]